MKPLRSPVYSSVAALTILGAPAYAEVTPGEVWENIQSLSAEYGETVTAGTETMSGDTLTLENVSMVWQVPEFEITGSVDRMELTQQDDGSVSITISSPFVYAFQIEADGEDVSFDLMVEHSGLDVTVDQDGDAVLYDYLADSVSISVDEIRGGDEIVPLEARATANGLSGGYAVNTGEEALVVSESEIVSLELLLDVKEPGGEGDAFFRVAGQMNQIVSTFEGDMSAFAAIAEVEDLEDLEGLSFFSDGAFSHAGSQFDFAFADGDDTASGAFASEGGSMHFVFSNDVIDYGGTSDGVTGTLSGSSIPFPSLNISIAEAAYRLAFPASASDEPADFNILTRIVDLQIDDVLWMLADPTSALPREPVTLIADISGKLRLFSDLMSEESIETDEVPGEIHALSINELQLKAVGADLTGAGEFAFDNDAMSPFGVGPKPTGNLNLKLVGGNALLDRLINMGMLPQEQAMGARMMMGLFARPGDGPDTLLSEIQITEEGGILANGQPIQ